jgi:hypothetical protein
LVWAGETFLLLGPFAYFGLCGLAFQLVSSVLLLVGCFSYNKGFLLPWLVQTLVAIITALVLGPIFIYKGVHLFPALEFFLGISFRVESWTLTGAIMVSVAGMSKILGRYIFLFNPKACLKKPIFNKILI